MELLSKEKKEKAKRMINGKQDKKKCKQIKKKYTRKKKIFFAKLEQNKD